MVSDDLRKRFPNMEEFWPYQELLNHESPRGQVLISTGFLEERLKEILLSFMLDSPQARDLLGGGNAALGTFSSRISACFVLGLISDDEHRDLHLIRRIRNDFAHDIHTTFETESVVNRCRELKGKAHDYESKDCGRTVIVEPRGQFTTAAVSLIMNFVNRPHYVSEQRCEYGGWAY